MKPVEDYFDLYFDKRSALAENGLEFKIGISPPDFYRALKSIRQQSKRSLNQKATSESRIEERERKKVMQLLEESRDYEGYLDYIFQASEEIVMIYFGNSQFDGRSRLSLKVCRQFHQKYHACFRLFILDDDSEAWSVSKLYIRCLPLILFYFNNERIGIMPGCHSLLQLENYTDSLYEKVMMKPCRVPEPVGV